MMSLSAETPASNDNVIENFGGHMRGITTIDGGTRLYNADLDLGGFLLPGEIDDLQMYGGTASNGGLISSMTYMGGNYTGTYNGATGTIGSLNLAGDSSGIDDWGTVNNLAFADNGSGFLSISGFAKGGDFGFTGINVTNSVDLANANLLFNLSGSVDDWFGTALWDNIFSGASVTGWETALFNVSWDSGLYTDWLSYGDTWSWGGYVVAFGADGMTTGTGAVPEPATLVMIGLGLAGLGYARRRQQMRATAA